MTQAETFIAHMGETGLIEKAFKSGKTYKADKCTGKHNLVIDQLKFQSKGHIDKVKFQSGVTYPETYWFKDLSQIFVADTFTNYLLKVNQK